MGIWNALAQRLAGRVAAAPPPGASTGNTIPVPPTFEPPGHFYSPLPSLQDISEFAGRRPEGTADDPLIGVDLGEADQLLLLQELAEFYPSMPFKPEPVPGLRYRFENPSYSYADGTFLHTMLRRARPRRIIEVGSGFTSALTLDTNDQFLDGQLECCFIDPYPQLLNSLLTDADRRRVTVIPKRLQDVDLSIFATLGPGDVLFIDSTHVAKLNSDVNRLFFEVLPRLAPGTLIHVHDVFPGLEYPIEWLRAGRAWNEQYLLHAFLQFNSSFRVRLFGPHMISRYPEWFRTHMPVCLVNPGGAFWMERVR